MGLDGCGIGLTEQCLSNARCVALSTGTIAFSSSAYNVNETAGTVTLAVVRAGGASGAASVRYATVDGTATAGVAYTSTSGTLSWVDGDSGSKSITVPILNQELTSGTQSFTVNLSGVSGASTGTPAAASVIVTDNDVLPGTLVFSAPTYGVNEAAGTVTLLVTRTGGSGGAASVNYATVGGTAVAGIAYTTTAGTLSWIDGDSTSKSITVPILNQALTSGTQSFSVSLSGATGATIGTPTTANVIIADNDVIPGNLEFSASTYSVNEAAGSITLAISRTGGSSGAASVQYATVNGTASAGIAYTVETGTLSWLDGDSSSKSIIVPILDQGLTSGSQSFAVHLSGVTGATIGIPSTATVSIADNDIKPQISWATPGAITYGTALSSTQLNATSNIPGTFTYSPAPGVILGAGSQTLSVVFVPSDGSSSISAMVNLVVQQATPTLTWQTPPSFQSGQALTSAQLDATSAVPGTFLYTPALGTVMTAGMQTLSVIFTPNDRNDYTTATASVILTVQGPIVADCNSAYSYISDQHLCKVNSVAAPHAIAVRVSSAPNNPNQPIVVMPADGSAITVYLSAITTEYFAPVTYSWAQVQPVIDSYASKSSATFSAAQTSGPQTTVTLPTSGIYQFQVTATDANNNLESNYVWVNAWSSAPAVGPGNIGLNPGIAPPTSVTMLSADPGPFNHPRLFFSAGDWADLSSKSDPTSGAPEVLAGLAALRTSMANNFDKPGTVMNNLENALLKYAADGYSDADYAGICTLVAFTPGSATAPIPDILNSQRDSALATNPNSYFSDGLAVASYLAWLAVDPTQPSNSTSAAKERLVQLGTVTAAMSHFLLVTELNYPALYTGSNSGSLANYSLALAYDLDYNSMTAAQQATTRDYLYTIGNLYDTQGGGIGLYSSEPRSVPSSTGQNGVDFPNLADGIDTPALVIEGEENLLSATVAGNPAFGSYVAAANSSDPNVKPESSWPYANQCSVRNLERQIRANSEYILTSWGFHHTMEAYFNLGQNISATGTYAYARRGENLWASTYLYQSLLQSIYNIVPEQRSGGLEQILDHQDGSGFAGGGGQRNFYYLAKAMYPDDPMIDYVYRQAIGDNGNTNALTRAIFGQILQTSDLNSVAQDKKLGLTKFDPLLGFAISRNGWSQDDLSMVMMNFTLGNGHYHAEANSFTLTALGRVWSNPPQYHVVPGDAQQQISILMHTGATDASEGYIGQGPSSYDYLHDQSTGGPFHGVLLGVLEDPSNQWTWFAGDSKPAYDWVGGTVVTEDGTTVEPVDTGLTNDYMLIPGLTNVLIPSDAASLTTSTEFQRATPYNPVLYSFRSILTVRGAHPYVLIIDDMNKDGSTHDYRWSMNNSVDFGGSGGVFLDQHGNSVYASLQIEPGATATDATLYHTIDAANTVGLPRLLVRDVSEQPPIGQPAIKIDDRPIPATGATAETNLTYGVDNNTHQFTYFPSRRLFIDRNNVVQPKYKILLFPFGVGDTLPTTSWNSSFTTLTVKIGIQVDTITFDSTEADHRTRLVSFERTN